MLSQHGLLLFLLLSSSQREAAAAAAGRGERVCKLTAERVTNGASASTLHGGMGRCGGAESWQSPYAEGLQLEDPANHRATPIQVPDHHP